MVNWDHVMDGYHLPSDGERSGVTWTPEQLPVCSQWQYRLFPEVSAGPAERVLGGDLLHTVRRHALQQFQQVALHAGYRAGEDAGVYYNFVNHKYLVFLKKYKLAW
jgi:hypothetical protein